MPLNEQLDILLVEDNDTHALVVRRQLEKTGHPIALRITQSLAETLEHLADRRPHVILLDLGLPDSQITETLPCVIKAFPDIPVVALTSLNDLEFAATAVQQGAQDYLVKTDLTGELLLRAVRYAIERKKSRDKLESYAAELERSNDHLKSFAHTVAHEVKSPLTPIKGCIDILKTMFGHQFDADITELVENSEAAIIGMTELVNELLEFARLDSGDQEYVEVEMEAVFYQAYVLLRPMIKETGASVTHDPLPNVLGKPAQLRQLLQNLVGNAIKYRREETPMIHVSCEDQESHWRFSVRDNGFGIDASDLERVFEVFVRLSEGAHRPGTGIGLGFCKRIVENHGGRIWAESTVGTGSTFFFELPKPGTDAS